MRTPRRSLLLLLPLASAASCAAADLVVTLPPTAVIQSALIQPPPTQSAQQMAPDPGAIAATITGGGAAFTSLAPSTSYDVQITLQNGQVLQGVNLAWYSRESARPDAGPLTDDDRRQIAALVTAVKSFYNISRIITLAGDHDRATVLVERIRSAPFHSDAGGEVIWRVELWYFVNDFGGWNQRPQTNNILRRRRFKSPDDYNAAVAPLRWVAALGGISFDRADEHRRITLPAHALAAPATQP